MSYQFMNLPRVRGLEMIDPTSAVIDRKVFLPLAKSVPNLDKLTYRKKRALSKANLRQKESYWSTDVHVQYVPFSKNFFNPPAPTGSQQRQQSVKNNNTLTDLDASKESKRSQTANNHQVLKTQKSKKRIIINLDDRFNTKVRPSIRSPPQLSTTNTSDSVKVDMEHKLESEQTQDYENRARTVESFKGSNNIINIEEEKKSSQNQSTNDISHVRFAESPDPKSFLNSAKPKSSKGQRRDVLEISQMYLKDPKDIQDIAERKKMFEDIRKGNAKRAKTLEQMRLDNLKKVMTQKPVFYGREYCYQQAQKDKAFDQVMNSEDANQFYTANGYKKDNLPLRSAMTIGTKNQAMQKKINFEKIKKFRICVRRYKIVTLFWKAIDQAIMKKRQIKLDTFSVNLKDSIQTCMKFTLQSAQQSFLRLFKETENLAYYTQAAGKQMYVDKRAKLRQHCLNIMQELATKTTKAEKDFSFIKLIAKNSNNYEFPPQNFWPGFIIKRVQFTKIGSLKNITTNQKEMITLLFFIVYGLFNRLVRPWTTLKLEQSEELAKNSQLVLSLIFYVLHDYLKEKNPIIAKNFQNVNDKYYLQERDIPLNAYPDLLSNESEIHQNKPHDATKTKLKLEQQVKDNDNIIIGISSRKKLQDLVDKDTDFIEKVRQNLQQISANLLAKADEVYPELKDKLLSLI